VVAALGAERFIIGPFPMAEEWVQPGGMERSLVEMVEHPALLERALQSSLRRAEVAWPTWRNPGYDATMNGTDWAYRSGPFMSPRMWRRYCYPALAANVRAAHQAGLLFVQHACGNNWPILEGFMEAGVDCYQSIQASAEMDLARVRAATRGRMALWGGVQVEHLVSGSPEEVRADVRAALEVAKEGGFILGATHSIAVGTSYDNFMAMLDEFDRRRKG
jgi:uroporphyrinogen-III decarboxylase